MVAEDLEAGRLSYWGTASDRDVEIWVLHTSRRLVSPNVAAFVRFLQAAFPDGRAWPHRPVPGSTPR